MLNSHSRAERNARRKAAAAMYREKHREEIRENQRKRRAAMAEYIRAYQAKWKREKKAADQAAKKRRLKRECRERELEMERAIREKMNHDEIRAAMDLRAQDPPWAIQTCCACPLPDCLGVGGLGCPLRAKLSGDGMAPPTTSTKHARQTAGDASRGGLTG